MVLGRVISKADFPAMLNNVVLALFNTISDSVETHVQGFGEFFLFNCISSNSFCSLIVYSRGSSGLGVAHFFECCANGATLLSIKE